MSTTDPVGTMIRNAITLAENDPGFIYTGDEDENACSYFATLVSPPCIFGQALENPNCPIVLFTRDERKTINAVLFNHGYVLPDLVCYLLNRVQMDQDNQEPWDNLLPNLREALLHWEASR